MTPEQTGDFQQETGRRMIMCPVASCLGKCLINHPAAPVRTCDSSRDRLESRWHFIDG